MHDALHGVTKSLLHVCTRPPAAHPMGGHHCLHALPRTYLVVLSIAEPWAVVLFVWRIPDADVALPLDIARGRARVVPGWNCPSDGGRHVLHGGHLGCGCGLVPRDRVRARPRVVLIRTVPRRTAGAAACSPRRAPSDADVVLSLDITRRLSRPCASLVGLVPRSNARVVLGCFSRPAPGMPSPPCRSLAFACGRPRRVPSQSDSLPDCASRHVHVQRASDANAGLCLGIAFGRAPVWSLGCRCSLDPCSAPRVVPSRIVPRWMMGAGMLFMPSTHGCECCLVPRYLVPSERPLALGVWRGSDHPRSPCCMQMVARRLDPGHPASVGCDGV